MTSKKHRPNLVVYSLESALPVTVAMGSSNASSAIPQEKNSSWKDAFRPSNRPRSGSEDSKSRGWTSPLRRKKKDRKATRSANSSPVRGSREEELCSSSSSSTNNPLEATPENSLPGGRPVAASTVSRDSDIPTILVSPEEDDDQHMWRKLSQGSSTMTSGGHYNRVGSLLSPSGDEDGISDQESPLSPLSAASSIGGSAEDVSNPEEEFSSPQGTDGETDYIEEDCPPSSPMHEPTAQALAIPPLRLPSSASSSSSSSSSSNTSRKRDLKLPWKKLKKVVQWSPFVQVYKKKYPWVQLAGHQGNFEPGEGGTIMKKSSSNELESLRGLMSDELRPFVPEFVKEVEKNGQTYIAMSDLLRDFDEPAVMDIKMGVRTYLEDELAKGKTKLRPDLYQKMISVDRNEPSEEEHAQEAISKPRYMQWRETLSSSATLGFRIEGIKTPSGKPFKDELKKVRDRADVVTFIKKFIADAPSDTKTKMYSRLIDIRNALTISKFFQRHEVIGSSLLFVYDKHQISIHMIDFGKTTPLPAEITVDHRSPWVLGNHEDGYLFGLDNLISLWEEL